MLVSPFGKAAWHPCDATHLRTVISQSSPPLNPGYIPRAIVCPHAGYKYCAGVLGRMMALTAAGNYQRVLILGPSHHQALGDVIAIPRADSMSTALGTQVVDQVFFARSNWPFIRDDSIHAQEPSTWMMLPYLQYHHPQIKVCPCIVGELSWDTVLAFAQSLTVMLDESTLLVISSDFTHYGAAFSHTPMAADVAAGVKQLDDCAIDFIAKNDALGFWRWCMREQPTICGRYALAILLAWMHDLQIVDRRYLRSADISGDWTHSVSYVGLALAGR